MEIYKFLKNVFWVFSLVQRKSYTSTYIYIHIFRQKKHFEWLGKLFCFLSNDFTQTFYKNMHYYYILYVVIEKRVERRRREIE